MRIIGRSVTSQVRYKRTQLERGSAGQHDGVVVHDGAD